MWEGKGRFLICITGAYWEGLEKSELVPLRQFLNDCGYTKEAVGAVIREWFLSGYLQYLYLKTEHRER